MRLSAALSLLVTLLVAGGLGWLVYDRLGTEEAAATAGRGTTARPVPVEVAAIRRGPIALKRNFTGTLEARAEFVVSPKIEGRLVALEADLGDPVTRDQVVARLDDAEPRQDVARAAADLAVAEANLAEARSLLEIAERELARVDQLRERGVSSVSQRDVAKADELAKAAHVQVTRAQVARAEAELEAARIRLGYTRVTAAWRGGTPNRVVAERYVDEGETVAVGAPLLRIVELDPITGVFFVTERDYARLRPDQRVEINTDAYPGETFRGRIARIAPVFREDTRQARVELSVANPDLRLKPGMYIRAQVVLEEVADAVIVPERALARRDGEPGVFVVAEDAATVSWRPVTPGIREGALLQVSGAGLTGRVVTLGQQLLEDGSSVTIADGGGAPG